MSPQRHGRGRWVVRETHGPVPVHHTALPVAVKDRTRLLTKQAITAGHVRSKPAACETCGTAGPVELHHEDYRDPLKVAYLCSWCHGWADHASREEASDLTIHLSTKLTFDEKAALLGVLKTEKMQPRALFLAFINSPGVRDAVRRYFLDTLAA